eukprot:gene20432-23207_t
MSRFEGIFNHTLLCGGLTRIVFITAPPCALLSGVSSHNAALNAYIVGNMLRASESAYHIYKTHGTRTHKGERGHHRRLAMNVQSSRLNHGTTSTVHGNKHSNTPPVRKKAASDATPGVVNAPISTHTVNERVRTVFPVNLVPVQLSVIDSYTLLQPLLYFNDSHMWDQGVLEVNKLLLTALSIDRHFSGVK